MRRSRRFGLALLMIGWVLAMLPSVHGQTSSLKLGVFDPQRVSEETIEGKRIQAVLTEIRTKTEKGIEDQTTRLAELQQQLEQQGLSLSEERRATLEIEVQQRLLELNNSKDIATRGFQLQIQLAEARFNEKLRNVINEFARNEGFTVILESGSVAFAASTIDVTTAVIDLFDKMHPASAGGDS